MKNLIKTATALAILVTGSLTAQSFTDKTEIESISVIENDLGEKAVVKTITTEEHPIIFEDKDEFKLNQRLARSFFYVERTVLVDIDSDKNYEKEAHFSYIKEDKDEAYYVITEDIVSDLEIRESPEDIIFLEDTDIIE